MRWQGQKLGETDAAALPGLEDRSSVLRTVTTPEFAGMTFHEVLSRSALNKVPGSSRMPFGWTINPYRGCSHACVYCVSPDTLILCADGRQRPLRELEIGDEIIGTEVQGFYRRYVRTTITAKWSTRKPAYRVTLADGTRLEASGDHRFLTDRGWKHVTDAETGQRPHLTLNNRLMGFGVGADDLSIEHSGEEYRRGYLAGMIRGDGMIFHGSYPSPRRTRRIHRFRLALIDDEALDRSREILLDEGVPTRTRPSRKMSIEGTAVKTVADLRVVEITPLDGERDLLDITTGTGDFIANGVISHNCFARGTHEYLDLDGGADFDSQIVVKVNVVEVLEKELRRGSWQHELVALGTNTDPYQRAEGRYRLMPGIIEALAASGTPMSILTKGTLIRRDIPLLVRAAERVHVDIQMSIAMYDDDLQKAIEPGAPTTQARLDTVKALTDAGFRVTVFLMPIMPHLTDSVDALDTALARIRAAGAARVIYGALHLRPGVKPWFFQWLGEYRPDLLSSYRGLYPGVSAEAPKAYRQWLAKRVRPLIRMHGLDGRHEDDYPVRGTRPGFAPSASSAASAPAQPMLF
ncbi:radical SAM protein [Microbacterium sp. MYb72]|uniref:Rv2578c family radical SAM protein n=1 Tax=Microbacterium sp. MYb72 TaxID=1848693 RepID=UPI000CFB8D83|nr:Rv2578c family radical SAM protein [Microbacterium sp. MYb72]PRB05763.1 radical SAM protein [Microbacterium sp. MYb72]